MATLEGNRVENLKDMKNPGDYFIVGSDEEPRILWLISPNGDYGRIPNKGCGTQGEPEWTITVKDGKPTVDPSIDAGPGNWHGFLKNGVFDG